MATDLADYPDQRDLHGCSRTLESRQVWHPYTVDNRAKVNDFMPKRRAINAKTSRHSRRHCYHPNTTLFDWTPL